MTSLHISTSEWFYLLIWIIFFIDQHTHHPQYASKEFRNSTIRGMFGDSLAALDWTVGQVMKQLQASGIADNTFVFFTSDNG